MAATWPTTLPQKFNVQGFSYTRGDGRIKSQTDTGPGKMRRRSSSMPDIMRGAMNMDKAQQDILEAFVSADLVDGSLPFWFPSQHKPVQEPILVRFDTNGLPGSSPLGGDPWVVTMTLEVLP